MAITRHISHIKSKLTENGGPKLPAKNQLLEGEIAVNYAKGYETLSIKNESGDVITFSSDSYYTDKKLGSGFTGENSANTVTSVIESNERVVAASLNDLNERKLDASAYTPTDLSNYYTKDEVYSKEEIDDAELAISSALNDLNERKLDASAYTPTDLSNYYTKAETSGATEIQGALSGKQNTLSAGANISIANDVISVTGLSFSIDQEISSGTSASTNAVSTKAVFDVIKENEEIISSSLNDLNSRIIALEEIISNMQQQNP